MKFEPTKLSKVIEQNYSHLMPDFFEMQTQYLASLNLIYHDLDASLIAMVLTSKIYKNSIVELKKENKVGIKHFYTNELTGIPASKFKIKDISSILNLPRETVRRKKEKLIKDNIIIENKKKKIYYINKKMIERKIIDVQVINVSKFLSKFSIFFSRNKFFVSEVSTTQIKNDVEDKFLLYLIQFLDFQISYFSKMKTILDIESVFIAMLCALNTTAQLVSKYDQPVNSKDLFFKINDYNKTTGLNATSIAEITKVPRTTVLRKISVLEKSGLVKKDKFKRYGAEGLKNNEISRRILPIMDHNIKILGLFFSKCLETYSLKN